MRAHAHMTINEMVVLWISKSKMDAEHFPAVEPSYSTLAGISKLYSLRMLPGVGRVSAQRCICWCAECFAGLAEHKGRADLLDVPRCARRALTIPGVHQITCDAASGVANARMRQRELWEKKLKPKLKAGLYAAVQARAAWSTDEESHYRPGHFWVFELGEENGSPIVQTFDRRSTYKGIRFDKGESALCVRRWLHRASDDPNGLTFVHWLAPPGELLVVDSSELRAVGFQLLKPSVRRGSRTLRSMTPAVWAMLSETAAAQADYSDPSLRYLLPSQEDGEIRALCNS